jgi:integrase
MMKLVIRTKCKEGTTPLYTKLKVEGKGRWICLLIYVDIKEWEDASQTERKLSNYINKKGINKKVVLIEEAITDMRRHHRLTKENLDKSIEDIVLADKRDALKRAEQLGKEVEDRKKRNVKNFVVEHIRKIETGEVRTAKKEKYAEESIKNWKQFRRVFLDFYKIRPFEWDDINEALADRYISYLENVGYMKYTLDKHISLFKTIVGVAERQGLHNNHLAGSYLKSPQIREEDKTKEIYLTKDELSALYDMPLTGFEEQVRDVFLIGCFTALRYSDYSRIKRENIGFTHNGTKVIRIKQEKTAGTVVIPILDERLEALLKKYDYNVPEVLDQSLNRTIKKICKRLSITVSSLGKKERTVLNLKERRAEVEARKKGVELYEYDEQGYPIRPRWELVASHTARRSCITNMYLSKKFSVQQMMSVSGHKTETMFYKYVKLSLDEYADSVASAAVDGLF